MPPSDDAFLQVLHALVAVGDAPGKLIGLHERVGFVAMSDGSVAVVIHPSLSGKELTDRLRELLGLDPVTHTKLVLVGGGASMRDVLSAAQPRIMLRRMVQVFHLGDDGGAWAGRRSRLDSAVGRVLQEVGGGKGTSGVTRAQLAARLAPAPSAAKIAAIREHQEFIAKLRTTRPYLTYGLLVAIAAVFGLEVLFGGAEFAPTLVRLGANTSDSLRGEPWRLLASVMLHAGPLHILVNGYVLYALGGFVERVLGWERLAILFVAAGLGGSVASALRAGAALSVGASGAIWGLLGAAGALALRPGNVLPKNLVAPMRRTALVNLIINMSVSFLPQVDFMAHFGGGLVGAVLVLLITRSERAPGSAKAAAVGGLGLCVAAVAAAIAVGRPWVLREPPRLVAHAVGETGISVSVPDQLGDGQLVQGERYTAFEVGDLLRDAIVIELEFQPRPAPPGRGDGFLATSIAVPEGGTLLGARTFPESAHPTFEETYTFENGLVDVRRLQLRDTGLVIIDALHWANAPQAYRDAVPEILGSID